MTDIDVQVDYYDGGWQELTDYTTAFEVTDVGIKRVPDAVVNLFAKRSDLSTFTTSPFKLIRIQVNPDKFYPIFYGYINHPTIKTIAGTLTNYVKMRLECLSFAARLAVDYITFDYYKLQSAISPLADANAWTYRKMIEDFLAYPDSTRDGTGLSGTGFEVVADVDAYGIDKIIDGSCNWDRQTLFEAIRTTCDHIGYDGYYNIPDEETFTPKVILRPFSKASVATLADPFVGEPEYDYGNLSDLFNVIQLYGGIDAGVPNDGDRWTEFAYSKYSPAIWSVALTGGSGGTAAASDVDNTAYFDENLRVNSKCLKFNASNTTQDTLKATVNLANLPAAEALSRTVDLENRITEINFNVKLFCSPSIPSGRRLIVQLHDASDNVIWYQVGAATGRFDWSNEQRQVRIQINDTEDIGFWTPSTINKWLWYPRGTTTPGTFDWSTVTKMDILTTWGSGLTTGHTWGFYVDGLQFVGGYEIKPFEVYSETLNPPVKGTTSIGTYGIHLLPHQDTALSSFDAAHAEGLRLLGNLQNPIPFLNVTKPAPYTTQLRPSSVVTVDSVDRRIASIKYKWQHKTKRCDVTYQLTEKTAPLPPIWTEENMLRYLVK